MRLLLLLAVSAALAAPAVAAAPRPVLTIDRTDSFAVHGAHFKPRERVRVVAIADTRAAKTVVAGLRGRFTVRFPALRVGRCRGYAAQATGNKGSKAMLAVTGECAQP